MKPEERRSMILGEALRLFSERHYTAVTVREIAQACDMNVALTYHYFRDKETLVREALDHAIDQLVAGYEARRVRHADPFAELTAWLDVHAELAPTVVRMVKLMTDYARSGTMDKRLDASISRFYGRETALLKGALSRGIETGRFRSLDVTLLVRRIDLMLDGIFSASPGRRDDRVAEDISDLKDALTEWTGADRLDAEPGI
jgi:AcrR family transcriptional regulator